MTAGVVFAGELREKKYQRLDLLGIWGGGTHLTGKCKGNEDYAIVSISLYKTQG